MPRCPLCRRIATWRLLNTAERFGCRSCHRLLVRRRERQFWSFVIGICGGAILGLGLYLGVEFEGRFVFSWCFLLSVACAYLFLWSQMRVREVSGASQRKL